MAPVRPPATRPTPRPTAAPAPTPQAANRPGSAPQPSPGAPPSAPPTPSTPPPSAPKPTPSGPAPGGTPPVQPTPPGDRGPQGESAGQLAADDAVAQRKAKALQAAKESRARKLASMVTYPGAYDSEGKPQLISELPTDFDSDKHKPLARKDFAHAATYYEFRAQEYEKLAAKQRQLAQDAREGKLKPRGVQSGRLQKMTAQMEILRAQLESQGVDVTELLRNAGLLEEPQAAEQPQESAQTV